MKASRSIIVAAVSCAALNACFLDDDEDTPVNDPPVALDDVFAVSSTNGLAVLANDSDPEGDALTLDWVDTPLVGTAWIAAANTVDLQLPAGFSGFTKFRYRVRESTGLTAEATALVFVDMDPFKAVYLGQDGIFVNDLLTTYRVSAAEGSPTQIVSMAPSANGRALAYLVRETADTFRLMYVDLGTPGVARPVNPSVIQRPSLTGTVDYRISPDGRYVAFELVETTPSGMRTSLLVFDAQSAAAPILWARSLPLQQACIRSSTPRAPISITLPGSPGVAASRCIAPSLPRVWPRASRGWAGLTTLSAATGWRTTNRS